MEHRAVLLTSVQVYGFTTANSAKCMYSFTVNNVSDFRVTVSKNRNLFCVNIYVIK